jgi:RNA polymerase sigma-70 factor (ECF subfamily)
MTTIYRYLYYRVGDTQEAEDLTETVFLKVWEHLPRFQPARVPFRAWLYRVASNLLVDHYRTRKPVDGLAESGLIDPAPGPEQVGEVNERNRQLFAALRRLKPEHQEVLTLRFIADLSHAETARVMKRSEGAVRVLQHRALRALRQILSPEEDGSK